MAPPAARCRPPAQPREDRERKALTLSKLQITRFMDGEPVRASKREDCGLFRRTVDGYAEPRERAQKNDGIGLRQPPPPFIDDQGVAYLEPSESRNQRFVRADALERQRGSMMILIVEGPARGDGGVEDERYISICGPRALPRAVRRA
jgi:hypothetical protein